MRPLLTYAWRGLPWVRIGVAAVLVVILMELVAWRPWTLWPLEGTAVAVLAGAAGWCFDEQAAEVVDASPRGLAWRTSARAVGPALLVVVWAATVTHTRSALFLHESAVFVQGVVAIVVGSAWAVRRRSSGQAMPGVIAATAVIPVTTMWALLRPLERSLPVFPYAVGGDHGDWHTSTVGWGVVGAAAVVSVCVPRRARGG